MRGYSFPRAHDVTRGSRGVAEALPAAQPAADFQVQVIHVHGVEVRPITASNTLHAPERTSCKNAASGGALAVLLRVGRLWRTVMGPFLSARANSATSSASAGGMATTTTRYAVCRALSRHDVATGVATQVPNARDASAQVFGGGALNHVAFPKHQAECGAATQKHRELIDSSPTSASRTARCNWHPWPVRSATL